MKTLESSQQSDLLPMELPLTPSAEAFRARTLALQDLEQELKASAAGCGPNFTDSFAKYDPASCSWKTSQRCLVEVWAEFSETWPRAGMTRNGSAFERRRSGLYKRGTACGLLPTLCASEPRDSSKASILARMDKGGRVARRICNKSATLRLSDQIVSLNPLFAERMTDLPIGWTE